MTAFKVPRYLSRDFDGVGVGATSIGGCGNFATVSFFELLLLENRGLTCFVRLKLAPSAMKEFKVPRDFNGVGAGATCVGTGGNFAIVSFYWLEQFTSGARRFLKLETCFVGNRAVYGSYFLKFYLIVFLCTLYD